MKFQKLIIGEEYMYIHVLPHLKIKVIFYFRKVVFIGARTLPDVATINSTLIRFGGSGAGCSCHGSYFSAFCFARSFAFPIY